MSLMVKRILQQQWGYGQWSSMSEQKRKKHNTTHWSTAAVEPYSVYPVVSNSIQWYVVYSPKWIEVNWMVSPMMPGKHMTLNNDVTAAALWRHGLVYVLNTILDRIVTSSKTDRKTEVLAGYMVRRACAVRAPPWKRTGTAGVNGKSVRIRENKIIFQFESGTRWWR